MLGSCGSVSRRSRGIYLTPETRTLPGRRLLTVDIRCRSPLNRGPQLSRSVEGTPKGAGKSLSGDCGSREAPTPYGYRVYLQLLVKEENPNNWLPVRRDPFIRSTQAQPVVSTTHTQLVAKTWYHSVVYNEDKVLVQFCKTPLWSRIQHCRNRIGHLTLWTLSSFAGRDRPVGKFARI